METLKNMFDDGLENLHVVADFDGTLTKVYHNGIKRPSLISILRDSSQYLGAEYQKRAHGLYDKYSVFEYDQSLSLKERKAKMDEWWNSHFKLLIEMGLKKEHVLSIIEKGGIEFREGAKEFLELCNEHKVPVVIMSASGLGDAVIYYLKQQGCDFSNIYFVVNSFSYDENGNAISYVRNPIHSLNKDETILSSFPEIFSVIKDRKNVLVLGNSVGDSHMSDGFEHEKIFKVGFLDAKDDSFEMKISAFREAFDKVVSIGGFGDINEMF